MSLTKDLELFPSIINLKVASSNKTTVSISKGEKILEQALLNYEGNGEVDAQQVVNRIVMHCIGTQGRNQSENSTPK